MHRLKPLIIAIRAALNIGIRSVANRMITTLCVMVMVLFYPANFLRAELSDTVEPPTSMTMSQSPWWKGVSQWLETNLLKSGQAPFSFVYDGKNSQEFLRSWDFLATRKQLPDCGTQHILTYTDPKTGLEIRCEAIVFQNHPAVEWILKFKNTSGRETPIISDIQALNTTLTGRKTEYTLHHALGVGEGIVARKEDFRPIRRILAPDSTLNISPSYGRSSWGDSLPFFNIEMSNRQGVILSIGWTGQWFARFIRDAQSLKLQAGMEGTHLKLYPGEEIRTPRIMLLFWQGHRIYGQNLLRRIILRHYHPQKDGKPLTIPFLASSAALYHESFRATEQNQIDFATQFDRLGVEYLWLDMGWHDLSKPATHIGPIDPKRFPRGFRPLTDALKKMGMGLLVWFAPEYQGGGGSWMERDFSEYFLRLKDDNDGLNILNFGDRNALKLITDHTATMIQKEGIGIYRIDGPLGANSPNKCFQPLQWWRQADAPDRQGITEIRYIEGLYAFWDELRKRHPGLIIDLCGGGATRIDIEAMSRCIYLWRSDWDHPGFEPVGQQSQTLAANLWVPSTNIGSGYPETYSFRSSYNNGVVLAWNPYQPEIIQDWPLAFPVQQKEPYTLEKVPRTTVDGVVREGFKVSEPFPWATAERLVKEFQHVRHFFYGDFYPLTPYSLADDAWLAFQCHQADLNQGMVLAFRRSQCTTESIVLKLWDLFAEDNYEVVFEDNDIKRTLTGRELAEGLEVSTEDRPGSVLITYRRLP